MNVCVPQAWRRPCGRRACVKVGGALHHGPQLEVLRELGLVEALVEAFGVERGAQVQQPQVSLHLVCDLRRRQIEPAPASPTLTRVGSLPT
jgi:hypothetical protein